MGNFLIFSVLVTLSSFLNGGEAANVCGAAGTSPDFSAITTKYNQLFNRTLNLYDGPTNVSQAASSTTNTPLTLAQMKYYNYWSAATDCPNQQTNLTSCTAKLVKADVTQHWVYENTICDTMALVALLKGRQEIVIAYRGSRGLQNWLFDFTFVQTNCSGSPAGVKLHRGFIIATNCLYEKIVKQVITLLKANPGFKITVTGHSLGGALATMTTYFMKTNNQFPGTTIQLASFAQPRVGNPGFATYMNALGIPCSRVTAFNDIVPHLPSVDSQGTAGATKDYFVHHQPEIWDKGTEVITCKTDKAEDPNCSNSRGPGYMPSDHFQYLDVNYGSMCFNTSSSEFLPMTLLGVGASLSSTTTSGIPAATCPGKYV